MRCVCVVVLNCIMFFFFSFGVRCIELWWYDSAQPSTYIGKEQWSSEEPMRRYSQMS